MSTVNRQLRILVAKPGLDGHDRGAKIIARALRDAGIEVIYTGLHQTPEMIVATAIQEDVDAIGLSILSGAHMTIFPAVIDLLAAQKASDIKVFGGGIIPQDDVPKLKAKGVAELFLPGTSTQTTVEWIRANVKPREQRRSRAERGAVASRSSGLTGAPAGRAVVASGGQPAAPPYPPVPIIGGRSAPATAISWRSALRASASMIRSPMTWSAGRRAAAPSATPGRARPGRRAASRRRPRARGCSSRRSSRSWRR